MPSIVKTIDDDTEEADGGENEHDKIIEEPSSSGGKKSPTPQEIMEDVESVASAVELLVDEEPPMKKSKTSDDAAVDVEGDKKKCHDKKSDEVAVAVEVEVINDKPGGDSVDEDPPTKKKKRDDDGVEDKSDEVAIVDEKDEKSGEESAEKCAGEISTSEEEDKRGKSDELISGASAGGGSPKKSSSRSAKPSSRAVAAARANQDGLLSSSSNQNKRKRNKNDQQVDVNSVVDVYNAQQQFMAMQMQAAMLQNPMLMQQQMAMQQNPMFMRQMAMQNPQMMAMLQQQQQMAMLQNMHPQMMSNQVRQEQLQRIHHFNRMEQEIQQRLIHAEMSAANNGAGKPITVILILPPGNQIKLGMVLKDNKFTKLAELKWLAEDSPIRNQLPKKYHMDCCIAEIKCHRIGGTVAPKSSKHCQELLGQCKDEKEETTIELVLVKIPPLAKIGQTERDRERERMTAKRKLATEERRHQQEKVTAREKRQKQPAQRKQKEEKQQQQRLEPVKVLLTIPSDESIKLGMILRDNHIYNLPELVDLSIDSPIQTQIARKYQRGCCIVSLESHKIGGRVSIESPKHFLELISKCRLVASENKKVNKRCVPVTVEMLMIQIPVEQSVAVIDDSETSDKPSAKKPSPNKDEARTRTPKKKNSHESIKEWNKHFDNLVLFKRSNGHFNVSPSVYPELALWVFEQRINKSKLTKSRLRKFKSIDFPFYEEAGDLREASGVADATNLPNAPRITPSWDERYESLTRFKGRCGFFPASGDLHDWLEGMKGIAAHLSSQHIKKLHELGVKLDLPRERLEQLGIQVDEVEENSAGGKQTKGRRTEDGGPKGEFRKQLNETFWKSAEAAKMFGFSRGDDILKGLQDRINRLKKANESVNGWKTLVPNDGKEELYKQHDILKLRHKVQYLIKAYAIAMKRMNELSWMQCCKKSAEDLGELVSEMSSTLIVHLPNNQCVSESTYNVLLRTN